MSLKLLLDTSHSFDEQKIEVLDQVVAALHSGDVTKVAQNNADS